MLIDFAPVSCGTAQAIADFVFTQIADFAWYLTLNTGRAHSPLHQERTAVLLNFWSAKRCCTTHTANKTQKAENLKENLYSHLISLAHYLYQKLFYYTELNKKIQTSPSVRLAPFYPLYRRRYKIGNGDSWHSMKRSGSGKRHEIDTENLKQLSMTYTRCLEAFLSYWLLFQLTSFNFDRNYHNRATDNFLTLNEYGY